ncbi:EAL domain-containing protein [Asticcacaulis sp. 201]|uniref:bifunctional diguanylate cyclase/phosphodiesterase n=1 Tax=Asticcacaulis sp. 201 TaxID=3028787 RepID=UPI002916879E|nr:EAL domain-containing protein [Asticcacaulis sp. 201]MDV6331013.1 EAL domain-containing protein [Asticcacaulis sp. 201]
MFRVLYCLKDQHDWRLVLLAGVICLISCFVSALLIGRAQSTQGGQRLRWILAAGMACGFGIWATHFVAMQAFNPNVAIAYDLMLTLVSLICALVITTGGVEIAVSRAFPHARLVGGSVIGSGIATMHYLGMMALDVPGNVEWAPDLVIASILISLLLGALALWTITLPAHSKLRRVGWLILLLAIVGHHFTAMGAVTIRLDATRKMSGLVLSPQAMSLAITVAAVAVLSLCAFAVVSARRLDSLRADTDRRFRILLEGMEDYAIFMLDTRGNVVDWKAGGDRMNGYLTSDIVGRCYADVCAVDTTFPDQYRAALIKAAEADRAEIEGPARRANGKVFWSHTLLRALRDDDGKLLGFANITQDISERKATQDRVIESARNLDAALSNMPLGLLLFDRNEHLILANSRFSELYGLDPAFMAPGLTFRALSDHMVRICLGRSVDPGTLAMHHARHMALITEPGGGTMVSDLFKARSIAISHRPTSDGGWVSTFEDVTERRLSEQRIAHLSRHDGLTGLPNRLHFNEYLDQELTAAVRSGEQVAVIIANIDRFKDINDQRGHGAGDTVLKAVARRLSDAANSCGLIARFGGDEFAVVMRFDRRETVEARIAALSNAVCAPISLDGGPTTVQASFGVALYPGDGGNRETLLNNADLALNRAKSNATQKICFYDSGMDEAERHRRALAADLDVALGNGEFRLFYQVQHSVRTGEITGYEALIRWNHPERGFISPAEFIPIAEESGAIIAIGAWVLRAACLEALSWPNTAKIAVNLSPIQLNDVALIETVKSVLIETGLSPSRLELEITETTIIGDKVRALHLLRQIKALGVTIAIDDFGTGYSSLDTLNSFPFDKIKIDRSFLMEADKSPQARAIVRAILALGRSLGIPVLAEGVETESQLGLLREEGCDEAQGYLLGRPVEFIGRKAA